MEVLLQITMSCLRALSRQVAGAGGRWKQGGAGAVSWQCAWWRLGAGAGCWLCAWWRQGAGCWCLVLYTGAGAGRRELARRCSVLVPASDSEVITTAASDSAG